MFSEITQLNGDSFERTAASKLVREVFMEVTKSNGKQEGREMMSTLQKRREARSPHHLDPNWIHEFWRNRLQDHSKYRQVQMRLDDWSACLPL
jgi:hypothetical protein